MSAESSSFDELLQRIRTEYLETPSLRLTLAQAQRLWGLDRNGCTVVLTALVEEGFLRRGTDGRYARADPEKGSSSGSVA